MNGRWGFLGEPSSYIADEKKRMGLEASRTPETCVLFSLRFSYSDLPRLFGDRLGDCNLSFFRLQFRDGSPFPRLCLCFLIVFRVHDVDPHPHHPYTVFCTRWPCLFFHTSHLLALLAMASSLLNNFSSSFEASNLVKVISEVLSKGVRNYLTREGETIRPSGQL